MKALKRSISAILTCLLAATPFTALPNSVFAISNHMDSVGSKTTILFGDLDEDGIIDNNDVSLLSNHLSGMADFTNAQEVLADVTGDGDIGIGDLTCISRVVGGQQSIEEMPIYSKLLDSGYCGKNGNNVKYMLKNDGTFIIFGEGEMADYSISSSAKNFVPWKQYAEQIKTVQVYEGVTSIGASAFQDYKRYETRYEKDSIEYVFLPSSLISIGDSAFLWCDTIEEIIIPNSVTSIGAYAFAHCSKLSNITLSNNLSSISEGLFEYSNSLKTISFPKSITTIGSWAFMDSGIETLTIPDTVQIIRDFSFQSLSLKEITFEGDIKTYSSAFSGATNLSKVVFNGKITFPKSDVGNLFNQCKNLTYLKIPSVFSYEGRYYPIQSFMNFRGCDNLKFENITFNDKCKVIDGVLFSHDGKKLLWYNKDIKDSNYTIPDGVEEIDWQAFYGNNHIEHVVFSNTVKTLGGRAFQSCENLNNVIIPEGVEELFDFQFCTSLKRIVIPSSVNRMYQQDKNSTSTFERVRDIVFYCDHGSYCEQFIDEYSFLGEVRETVYCNFDANGGTVEKAKQAVIPQDKYWILPTPTRSGYDFDGWYTDKTGGTKITTESVVDPESSFTLFAHWITDDIEKPSVTLTATNDINPSQNVTIDLCDNIGIKGYYWGTSSSYSNNAYTTTSSTSISKTVDSAGTYYATAVDTSGNVSSTVSITFYKTTLNANGGSVSPTLVLTKSGNSFTFPTPTRSNYTYDGWSTSSSATSGVKTLSPSSNETYYAVWSYVDSQEPTVLLSSTNNVASSQTVTISLSDNVGIKGYYWGTSSSYSSNAYSTTSSTTISKTVDSAGTYYATAVDTSDNVSSTVSITFYKITLNANGGSVSPTSVLTKSGNSFTFPIPTRSNYTYVGWSTSSSATSGVKTISPSSNAIYYAVWKSNYTFVWGQDNWNFYNSDSYFGNYYYVDNSILNTFKRQFEIDNTELYTMKEKMNYYNSTSGFMGSCYGMTVSEILVKQGFLNLSDYGGSTIVNQNGCSNTKIMSLINAIQLMQNVGDFSQTIRQTPFSRTSFTQSEFISKLEDVLQNNQMFVKIGYSIKSRVKSSGEYLDNGSHAVLAYGIESCNYYSDVTYKTYDKKILICDPNRSGNNSISDDACIYYKSSDHSWIIPYWNGDYYSYRYGELTEMCYWNSGSSLGIKSGSLNNIMKYDTITESTNLLSEYSTNHYIAGVEINSNNEATVQEISESGNPNMEFAGGSGSGVAKFVIESEQDIYESNPFDSYALWNPTANYSVSFSKPSNANVFMDYENISYYLDSSNANYILYKPSGYIQINGAESDYSLTMVTDDLECVTDWYALTVKGNTSDNTVFKKINGGYILTASNLNNITIEAENLDVNISRKFSTSYNKVFIYEIDETTIGLKVDTDGNGTFETELPTSQNNYKVGDTNLDGIININDVTAIQRHIAKLEKFTDEQLALADTNGDGIINIIDATHLQKYLAEFDGIVLGKQST